MQKWAHVPTPWRVHPSVENRRALAMAKARLKQFMAAHTPVRAWPPGSYPGVGRVLEDGKAGLQWPWARLSAAHRHCLASLARGNQLFLQAIWFPKP
jgi:hypothetical protein